MGRGVKPGAGRVPVAAWLGTPRVEDRRYADDDHVGVSQNRLERVEHHRVVDAERGRQVDGADGQVEVHEARCELERRVERPAAARTRRRPPPLGQHADRAAGVGVGDHGDRGPDGLAAREAHAGGVAAVADQDAVHMRPEPEGAAVGLQAAHERLDHLCGVPERGEE